MLSHRPQHERPVYTREEARELLRSFDRLDGGATAYYYEIVETVRV